MPILIDNIKQLITMSSELDQDSPEPEIGMIYNGAVVIEDDKISWVGNSEEVSDDLRSDSKVEFIDGTGSVVIPGLIDAHTHLIFAGSRENEFGARLRGATYEQILADGGGIHSTVQNTRNATPFSLFDIAMKRLDTCLDYGVTTVEVKSGYGLDLDTEIKILEVAHMLSKKHSVDVVPTFLGAHVVPKEFQENRAGYIELIIKEMLPRIKSIGLAEYIDIFIEEGAFSLNEARSLIIAGAANGLKPRLHIDQFNDLGGVELACEFGASSVDHLEALSEKGIQLLADNKIPGILLPGASFFLRMKEYAPARKMLDSGVITGLATDFNPGSCMTQMPFIIMTIACLNMGMTPGEVLIAFTKVAAKALDRDDRGVLIPGKRADVVILDVESYESISYHFAHNHVKMVIKEGQVVRSFSNE